MQLLKITTKPIQYTMEVENASLKPVKPTVPQQTQRTPGLSTQKQVQPVRTDDVSFAGVASQTAQQTVQAYGPATVKAAHNEAKAPSTAQADLPNAASLESTMAQIPRGSVDRSWEPPKPASAKQPVIDTAGLDEAVRKPDLEYTPGGVDITVEELAKVEIEYLGGPTYFPKSSDPEYEDPNA